jgi:serine/threonine protein phosphatase 1
VRWIIGDIHGMRQPLENLLAAVSAQDSSPKWFFVGDYVNRGPDSKGVVDLLLKLPNAHFCRGNHDDIFDLILNGISFTDHVTQNNRAIAYRWFMEHGLADTLASYGIDRSAMAKIISRPTTSDLDHLLQPVPANHRKFFRDLIPAIEEPDLFVTHARWEPDTPDLEPTLTSYLEVDHELRKITTWGRFMLEELDAPKVWKRTGYFGHTPVDNYGERGGYVPRGGGKLVPIIGNKIVLLDTAIALSPVGRLTAYCPDTAKYLQTDRLGNLV